MSSEPLATETTKTLTELWDTAFEAGRRYERAELLNAITSQLQTIIHRIGETK